MDSVYRINIIDPTYPEDITRHFTHDVELFERIVDGNGRMDKVKIPEEFDDVWEYLQSDYSSMPDIIPPYILLDEVNVWEY